MEAQLEGTIASSQVIMGRRRSLLCRLQDDSGALSLRFFHFNAQPQQHLRPGLGVFVEQPGGGDSSDAR